MPRSLEHRSHRREMTMPKRPIAPVLAVGIVTVVASMIFAVDPKDGTLIKRDNVKLK